MPPQEDNRTPAGSAPRGQETAKPRAVRIPVNYHRTPNPMERWKRRFWVLALLVSVAALVIGLMPNPAVTRQYSRGDLAQVHAMFDANCNACHSDFNPIGQANFLTRPVSAVLGKAHQGDKLCQECHQGPAHSATEKPESVPSCGTCHRDHQGRGASLIHLGDADCTRCHNDLKQHMTGPSKMGIADVVRHFPTDHPPFKPGTQPDPGKLKFNHALHLREGLGLEGGGPLWKLSNIPEAERARYKAQQPSGKNKDDDLVKLDCAACHTQDGGSARSDGAYMAPINYEQHCSACHSLKVESASAGNAPADVVVPHGLQPAAVRSFLLGAYRDQQVQKLGDDARRRLVIPGAGPENAAQKQFRDRVGTNVQGATGFLFQDKAEAVKQKLFGKSTCGECHHFDDPANPQRVVKPDVPVVWFKHAKFDHAPHRAVACAECHPGVDKSATEKDVLLPKIDVCGKCHAPASGAALGKPTGGARNDCTECHLYHHRTDNAALLRGLGAAAREAGNKRGIDQFLQGAK